MKCSDVKVALALGLLLMLHIVLAWRSTLQRSMTVDEIFHITGGYFFNQFGDYRLHPENGILPQRLHALPAVMMGAKPPPLEGNEHWRWPDLFVISNQLLHESGNDDWQMLLGARAMNLIFSVGVCGMVFLWARNLAGNLAGLVALTLAALSPTLLAHGPLATTDMAAALFLPASAGAFWWQLQRPFWTRVLLSAVVFGLACVAKYSAVLLLPIFGLLIAIRSFRPNDMPGRFKFVALSLCTHAAVGWLIIWACFGFRYSGFSSSAPPGEQFIAPWEYTLNLAGWQASVIQWFREIRLFPEAFLFGYTHTYVGSFQRATFLAGEYGVTGWRSFFPLAFLWKSTPIELLGGTLCVVGAVLRWRTLRTSWTSGAPLLVLAIVYGAVAIMSHLNIGHRHLLPIYPVLFIASGVAVAAVRRLRIPLVAAFACGQILSATNIHPYHLAYFNGLAGGPANGWRLLVDSSLDWGQDLPALERWLDAHNSRANPEPVFLSYFGSTEPSRYGVDAKLFFSVPPFKKTSSWHSLTPGIYCISATNLQEVYSPVRGAWTAGYEKEYQNFRVLDAEFEQYFRSASEREQLLARAPAASWEYGRQRYAWLRHARLSAYLRARGPDAMAGYSILIFRVTAADLKAALHSPFSEWLNAVEELRSREHR